MSKGDPADSGAPRPLGIARNRRGQLAITGFGRPFGVGSDTGGRVLVADMDLHAVCRLSPDLRTAQWLGFGSGWTNGTALLEGTFERATPRRPGLFNGPHSAAVDADGRLHVVTYYTPGLLTFDRQGALIRTVGAQSPCLGGPATGHLDSRGRLLVSEYARNGVYAFDPSGDWLGAVGNSSSTFVRTEGFEAGAAAGSFDRPHMCRELPDGTLIVADTWNHRLVRLDHDGRSFGWLSEHRAGWRDEPLLTPNPPRPDAFHAPVAIGVVETGAFVVTDWGNKRLQWFDSSGRHLETLSDLGLDRPYDAQPIGRALFIADSHNGRLLVSELE